MRLRLLNHPETEIVFINSSSNAGNRITDVHEGLYGETDLRFTDQLPLDEIDVLFFCTAHGDTKKFMESHNIPEDLKIIDLSMDYRIMSDDHDFIYGLPELNRRATCTALLLLLINKISVSGWLSSRRINSPAVYPAPPMIPALIISLRLCGYYSKHVAE